MKVIHISLSRSRRRSKVSVLPFQRFKRERHIYKLLDEAPGLLEKGSRFRLLRLNSRAEKGPDFIGFNKRGHLILGEIKAGSLRANAWRQVKRYAKQFAIKRRKDLEKIVDRKRFPSLKHAYGNFLSRKAQRALLNPAKRRRQLVLVEERFSDKILARVKREKMNAQLQRYVKDVKCLAVQVYEVPGPGSVAVTEVLSGKWKKLGK
jgi:hypothetical protein